MGEGGGREKTASLATLSFIHFANGMAGYVMLRENILLLKRAEIGPLEPTPYAAAIARSVGFRFLPAFEMPCHKNESQRRGQGRRRN